MRVAQPETASMNISVYALDEVLLFLVLGSNWWSLLFWASGKEESCGRKGSSKSGNGELSIPHSISNASCSCEVRIGVAGAVENSSLGRRERELETYDVRANLPSGDGVHGNHCDGLGGLWRWREWIRRCNCCFVVCFRDGASISGKNYYFGHHGTCRITTPLPHSSCIAPSLSSTVK